MHRRLQFFGFLKFDIDADVLGKTPHEQIILLARRHRCVKTLLVVLEGQPRELDKVVAVDWQLELLVAQVGEALLRRHTLIFFQGVVQCLGHTGEVVRGEPIQGVLHAFVLGSPAC